MEYFFHIYASRELSWMSLPELVNGFQMLFLVQICEWAVSGATILGFHRVGPALILGKLTRFFDEYYLGR